MVSDAATCSVFADLYAEAVEEKTQEGTKISNAKVVRTNMIAKSKVTREIQEKLSFLPFPMAMMGMQTTPSKSGFQSVKNLNTCMSAIGGINVDKA